MADTKISGMTAATALMGAEVLPVVQSAANVKATTQQVVDAAMTTGLTRQALGSINTNTTIDWSVGSYVTATIGGALTFTFSNPAPTGKACVAYLQLTNGGSAAITWPISVTWSGGTAPTLRASGVDLLRFYTQDNGTTWFGTAEIDEQQFEASAITSGTLDAARLPAATTSSPGAVELAIAAEVDTGTDATRAMTPDSYRDSTPYYTDRAADWTLAQADGNTEQQFNSASALVCTIDTNANVAISIGTIVPLVRIGAGSATIDAVSGVTINGVDGGSKVISTRYQGALLRKTGTNAWILSGDIA